MRPLDSDITSLRRARACLVPLPTRADAIFDGVGTSAAARDTVVDGGLAELDIAIERGASASGTFLVGLEPQNRTSRYRLPVEAFIGFTFS